MAGMMVIRSRGRQSKCIADADATVVQALISPTSLHLRQHRSNMSIDKAKFRKPARPGDTRI